MSAQGRGITVCDAIRRFNVEPSVCNGAPNPFVMRLGPTLCCFVGGERIGLLISSGAHPRYLRNSGSDEPLATATELIAADQTVHLGPQHPSAMTLHVV